MRSIEALKESKNYKKYRFYRGPTLRETGDLFYFHDEANMSVWDNGKCIIVSYQDVRTEYKKREDGWKCTVSYKYNDYPVYYLTEEKMDENIGQFIQYHQNKEADQ